LSRWPKTKRRQLPEGLKSAPPDLSVREVWDAHIDAELSGTQDPRKVLDQLHDRERFPWKTLLFAGQNRPPYSGMWSTCMVYV
jgi:chromatin assembly factor 1 subunit A